MAAMRVVQHRISKKYAKRHLAFIHRNKSSSDLDLSMPTNREFRYWESPISKLHQTNNGRNDPFKIRGIHSRAKTKNEFEFDPKEEFSIHPIWTPLVPLMTIGIGIYIIVTGIIANPPGDDDDDD